MTSDEVLQGTIELLQDSDRWTKGVIARRRDGTAAGHSRTRDGIYSLCLVGAVRMASHPEHLFQTKHLFQLNIASVEAVDRLRLVPEVAAFDTNTGCPVPNFNDDPNTTHEDVLLVLKKALYDTNGTID